LWAPPSPPIVVVVVEGVGKRRRAAVENVSGNVKVEEEAKTKTPPSSAAVKVAEERQTE
jgi:hypothetical protein